MHSNIPLHDIVKGDLLAVTLRDGTRISGRALGRMQPGRGADTYITIRRVEGKGLFRVIPSEVAQIIVAR